MSASRVKLTPLGVTVLALLREGEMHPYEMLRVLLQRHRDRIIPVTKGTLYHTVGRLEEQGLIAEVGVDREGNRPERTSYALLPPGYDAVTEWVRAELPRLDFSGIFRLALVEAHNLPRAEALALLRLRREALVAEHEGYLSGLENARGNGVAEQYLIEVDRQSELLRSELSWLDGLLERLSSPDFPWSGDLPAPSPAEERTVKEDDAP